MYEYEQEIAALKCELDKVRKENADLKINNNDLVMKINHLEGQIDAYQYCINSKR